MMSPQERQEFAELKRQFEELSEQVGSRRIYQQDIAPKAIKQPHIDGFIVFKGLEEDLPSDGSTQIQVYWATDTGKLYIWDGEAWLSTTLS